MSSNIPRLWVVSTPIGNLGDMSLRARQTLQDVDLVLAEDTREAGKLMHRLDLGGKGFLSLHAHNEEQRISRVLSMLGQGKSLALISSAGDPVISDPGYLLVRACRQAGYQVSPVPGPSAVTAALICSGLPAQPFTFLGFLPRKPGEIKGVLEKYGRLQNTLIFFQRKSRLVQSLKLAYNILGPREVCLARELTKEYEELISFNLGQWDKLPENPRGEFTVVLGPGTGPAEKTAKAEVLDLLNLELPGKGSSKQIAKQVASQVQGWSTKDVYRLLLLIDQRQPARPGED